jgi:hypothetical protein
VLQHAAALPQRQVLWQLAALRDAGATNARSELRCVYHAHSKYIYILYMYIYGYVDIWRYRDMIFDVCVHTSLHIIYIWYTVH